MPDALMVLCHSDGRVATADRDAILLLSNGKSADPKNATISQIAAMANCAELIPMFEKFAAGEQAQTTSIASNGASRWQVLLRRLNGFQSQPLIAVEMNSVGRAQPPQEKDALIEIGRATSRLIHDYKNQMSGLKLYAAYLKKRFANQPEGVEIAEKIIQSLNEMTEMASLIGKLTRPMELKLQEEDLASLVKQVIHEAQPQAAVRQVEIAAELPEALPRLMLDFQQLRNALSLLLTHVVDSSSAGESVKVMVWESAGIVRLSITGGSVVLNDQQQQSFFDFLTNERLNKTALNLAFARRLIHLLGGTTRAVAAEPAGVEVLITFEI